MLTSRFLKHALLSTAILSFLGIGLYLFFEEDDALDGPPLLSSGITTPTPAVHTTIQPHFRGLDEKQQPYRITATSSTTNEGTSVTHLTHPTYTLTLHDGKTVHVTANKGVFDQEKKELVLMEKVVITHDVTPSKESLPTKKEAPQPTKTIMRMPFVKIDLDTGFAEGDQSMNLSNNQMIAHAGSFEIHDKGDKIVLTKNPLLRFSVKSTHAAPPRS